MAGGGGACPRLSGIPALAAVSNLLVCSTGGEGNVRNWLPGSNCRTMVPHAVAGFLLYWYQW
eukprot:275115-Rhodomonas_salina.1